MPGPAITAILAAAGTGARFGGGENKIFAEIGGRPVLLWSLEALLASPRVATAVIVANPRDRDRIAELTRDVSQVAEICLGGAERADSVWNALQRLPREAGWVAVHDAARPAASLELIERVAAAAEQHRAAVPALPVTDTLKRSDDGLTTLTTVNRREFFTVQTPQIFERGLLADAYREARAAGFSGTDDASYVERAGVPVRLVAGEAANLKITHPEDLARAARALAPPPASGPVRTGFGYDVHRLVAGRPLVLGGVTLEHPLGLDGHSDADVLLHALCDALLGAAALGDIGEHFPNTEERWRGVSSLRLLREVARMVAQAGWRVVNVDLMLIAEAPRIRPYVGAMTAIIAAALHTGIGQVNLKATTGEGMGFVGREEGMAAHAVATLTAST